MSLLDELDPWPVSQNFLFYRLIVEVNQSQLLFILLATLTPRVNQEKQVITL